MDEQNGSKPNMTTENNPNNPTPQDWDEWIKVMLKRYPEDSQMLIEGIVKSRITTENRIRLEQMEQEATGEKKSAKSR